MKAGPFTSTMLCLMGLAMGLLCLESGSVRASGSFYDEFTNPDPTGLNRDPVTWVNAWGDPIYIDNESLIVGDSVPGGLELGLAWVFSYAQDAVIESQFRILEGTNAGLGMVYGPSGFGGNLTTSGNPFFPKHAELIQGNNLLVPAVPVDFDPSEEDVVMRLQALGDQLSLWVWPADQTRPTEPLVTAPRPTTMLTYGFDVYVDDTGDGPESQAAFRYYRVDVLSSVVPRPVLPPYPIYTAIDNDFDDLGDTHSYRSMQPAGSVGEADTESNNAVSRLIAMFELPGGFGSILKSATLRLFLEDIVGTPAGAVSVFHSVVDRPTSVSPWEDYEDDSYEDTQLDLVGPASEAGRYYELDVTNLVLEDYAADGENPLSAFRLQINDLVFEDDDQEGRYRFTMPGAETNHPELVLTFIPEPSTWFLAGIGFLGLVACGWQPRRRAA